ncbi:hypothetical protein, partial [Ketobacter sp.]
MTLLKKLEPLFTMIGALSSALAVIITFLQVLPSNFISERTLVFFAEKFVPKGFAILPVDLRVIHNNTKFAMKVGDTALI